MFVAKERARERALKIVMMVIHAQRMDVGPRPAVHTAITISPAKMETCVV
jgi:hypothetical protein